MFHKTYLDCYAELLQNQIKIKKIKKYAQKNVEEFPKKCPFPPNVSIGIVEDIFGETDLTECESEENYTRKMREEIIKWRRTLQQISTKKSTFDVLSKA